MIVFFPTYARRVPGGSGWRATVAGMVSRPLPARSRRRTLAVAVLKRLLDLDDVDLDTDVFRRRAEAFLFQRVAGERLRISLGDRVFDAGQSDRSGHFHREIDLDDDFVVSLAESQAAGSRRLAYQAAIDDGEGTGGEAATGGSIHLIEPEGLSVISDIDDTVKVTNVANRKELLRNTLLREFVAVPGMAGVYRCWQAAGTSFHYVSASPWQLANCLDGFLRDAGLPGGSLHLKLFRLKDSTPLGRLPSRKRSKRRAIEQVMADFPGRRFLLVGDSGERDPEVYAEVAQRRPGQVTGIAIREVESRHTPEKVRGRLKRLARRLPEGFMTVFSDANGLEDCFPACCR
jgi:phosphatidate phosphatase APP1